MSGLNVRSVQFLALAYAAATSLILTIPCTGKRIPDSDSRRPTLTSEEAL